MAEELELPAGWERVSRAGPGPFVTSELLRAPDGRVVPWRSREHRKRSAAPKAAQGRPPAAHERVWWGPRRRELWMAVLVLMGSLCFLSGGVAAQWARSSRPA